MKHTLLFCLWTAFFISLVNCDCVTDCENTFTAAVQYEAILTQARLCTLVNQYVTCIETSCHADFTPYKNALQQKLKSLGYTCDLNVASRTLSGSLLTVSGAMLLTAYRILNL
ncbi:uncharacterized protein LOC112574490 [Pomacea canaliculata]|uniref:uncharacterized protein LOC112574490 n=1 Tax=Pomacea canaliculata TaxID=400727 RepID=UPI000D7299CE|nr:uncharacterized protein LOC112574490 [Pomacea canaliculata]